MLKIWLRSLKDPLIPTNLYHKCITVGSKLIEESITSDNVSKFLSSPLISEYEYILSKMDHTRKAILNHLTVLLYDIVQGKSTTKMEIGALSIIFAPSLIRNPLNDPTVQFKNFKMESRFVDLLFVFVKDSISKDAHETNTFLRKNSTVGKKKSLFEPGRKTSIVRRQTTSEILDSSQLRLFETNDTNVSSSMGSSFTSKTSDLTDFIDSRKSEQLDRSPRKGSSGFWGKGT